MNLRRGLIGLVGLVLVGGWSGLTAANQGHLHQVPAVVASPLQPAPEQMMTPKGLIRPEAMPLGLNSGLLDELRRKAPGSRFDIGQVLLEPGLSVTLELTRIEPFAPGAQVVLMEADGMGGVREKNVPIPDQVILAGKVVGQPESRVMLALAEEGCNGYLSTDSGLYMLSSPADTNGPPVIYPVGDRVGAIDIVPKSYIYPQNEKAYQFEAFSPDGVNRFTPSVLPESDWSQARPDSRANQCLSLCNSSRCCIACPFTDYDEFGRPDDWTCTDQASTQEDCQDLGGIWHGSQWTSENCNSTYRTQVTGACCIRPMDIPANSICVYGTLWDCEAMNGLFAGPGTTCDGNLGMCQSYGLDCYHATLGIDTDEEFLTLFDGDVTKAINYIALLVGASSEIFYENVSLRFRVRVIRFWSQGVDPWDFDDIFADFQDGDDPYGDGNSLDVLDRLYEEWVQNPPAGVLVQEELNAVHLLSGRSDLPQIASSDGFLCANSFGRGFSTGLHGSFPYPVVDFNPDNWDLLIFSRVMALLLQTKFTYQYTERDQYPVAIDVCQSPYWDPALPNCNMAFNHNLSGFPPTIMSKCYGCPGGISNISMQFHPFVRGEMFKKFFQIADFCRLYGYPDVQTVDDIGFAVPGRPVTLEALANDRIYGCFQASSSADYLDIDTNGLGAGRLDRYPRETPLTGYLTTEPSPNQGQNETPDRVLKYMPPCLLFETWNCPIGNPLQEWPNSNSTNSNSNQTHSYYIDSFSYRANSNKTDEQPGRNDNSTVRVVVSPPPMSWPSVCLTDLTIEPTSSNSIETRLRFDLDIDVPLDPLDPPPSQPYDVRLLSMGWINLNCTSDISSNDPGLCFELYLNDSATPVEFFIGGQSYEQICPFDPAHSMIPYLLNDTCGSWVFDSSMLNTNGDIRVDVAWNKNLPNPPIDTKFTWNDGRIYVQVDDHFGACCLTWSDDECTSCACMSASACKDMGGQFLGRGSACPVDLAGDPFTQYTACTLVPYGACEYDDNGVDICECLDQETCEDPSSNGGMFLGAGVSCPIIEGEPLPSSCLTFDVGACCFGTTTCEIKSSMNCTLEGGVFRGVATSCDIYYDGSGADNEDQRICSTDPPLTLGACCVPSEGLGGRACICVITTYDGCRNDTTQGVWSEWSSLSSLGVNAHCFAQTCDGQGQSNDGDGIDCFFDYDPIPEGACCLPTSSFPNGSCLVTKNQNCELDLGGVFHEGIPCVNLVCDEDLEPGEGACCSSTGTCVNLSESDCPDNFDFYPGLNCDGTSCPYNPEDTGLCCIGALCLDDRTNQQCLTIGGVFNPGSTQCVDFVCDTLVEGVCCAQTTVNGETYDYCVPAYTESECTGISGEWLGRRSCEDRPCISETDDNDIRGGLCCDGELCYPVYVVSSKDECQDKLGGTWYNEDDGWNLGDTCESGFCLNQDDDDSGDIDFRRSCDVNLDGVEDISDFLVIIQNYGQRSDRGDFNRDGTVTVDDILDYLVDCP